MVPRNREHVVVPAQNPAPQDDASVDGAVPAQPCVHGVGVLDGALAQRVVARAMAGMLRDTRCERAVATPSIAIHRGVVAAIHRSGRAREVGFVRREKGSMHLQSHADVPAAANGGHDRPSLSRKRAPQTPNGRPGGRGQLPTRGHPARLRIRSVEPWRFGLEEVGIDDGGSNLGCRTCPAYSGVSRRHGSTERIPGPERLLPIRAAACTRESAGIDVNPLSVCLRESAGEDRYCCKTAS